jgi:toxin-antitoxin system PIN domain toxin
VTATLDANVLLYASDIESPLQEQASEFLQRLFAGPELVYLFWPTAMAYLRIATHPGIFQRPQSVAEALANLTELMGLPHVRTPGEGDGFLARLSEVIADAAPRGDLLADAHLVALMRQHGVRTIWTRDRDFRRFDGIDPRDPFA